MMATSTGLRLVMREPRFLLTVGALYEGVNELNSRTIPLLAEEGWTRQLIEAGAPGAKREPDRAKPQLMVSSAKLFRPEDFAELTTITASRYRARASRPSAALTVASQLLVDAAATPPLRGGEYSTFNISSIHSHLL